MGVSAAETISNDLMLGSVPAEKSGAAAAISEAGYEVGSLLGMAVLGSILTASYQRNLRLPAGVEETVSRIAVHQVGETWQAPWSWPLACLPRWPQRFAALPAGV